MALRFRKGPPVGEQGSAWCTLGILNFHRSEQIEYLIFEHVQTFLCIFNTKWQPLCIRAFLYWLICVLRLIQQNFENDLKVKRTYLHFFFVLNSLGYFIPIHGLRPRQSKSNSFHTYILTSSIRLRWRNQGMHYALLFWHCRHAVCFIPGREGRRHFCLAGAEAGTGECEWEAARERPGETWKLPLCGSWQLRTLPFTVKCSPHTHAHTTQVCSTCCGVLEGGCWAKKLRGWKTVAGSRA